MNYIPPNAVVFTIQVSHAVVNRIIVAPLAYSQDKALAAVLARWDPFQGAR